MGPKNGKQQSIRFLLDGETHVVENLSPTTTVLQYLRDHLHRNGTKEGCAEGDCGACTVVLAELVDKSVQYRSINSCIQFLPTLDGKALLTVESLKAANGGVLHPVQQALVECHASQCGFCTPGFVMSLFALYKINPNPSDDDIRFALAGNLCRCTGYRPIIAAAKRMYDIAGDTDAYERELKERLMAIRVTREKRIGSDDHSYVAPTTVEELANYLQEKPEATILAGGTDVGLWVTKQHAALPDIVYIGNVGELRNVVVADGHIEIGSAVRLTDAFAALGEEYPHFHEIVRRFASPPICNAGTLCGNIANGSPIGDSMPALICLGATVVLRQGTQTRSIPLEDFYLGYMRNELRPGEFVASVNVPRRRDNQAFRSYKISKRFEQDISGVCAAFSVDLVDGRIQSARVCFGGMAEIPKRATACEKALTKAKWNSVSIEKATGALAKDFRPITDFRASEEYRLLVAGNLLKRFYAEVSDTDAETSVWNFAG